MFFNCGVGKDSWESLGLQGDPTSPSYRRSVLRFIRRTDVEAETPIHWPPDTKSWSFEKTLMLRKIEGRRRRGRQRMRWLDGITDSVDIWVNSGSWWWTGRPGVLQFLELQRVRHDWVTELNWTPQSKSKLRKICLPQPIYYFLLYLSVFNEHFNNSVYPFS